MIEDGFDRKFLFQRSCLGIYIVGPIEKFRLILGTKRRYSSELKNLSSRRGGTRSNDSTADEILAPEGKLSIAVVFQLLFFFFFFYRTGTTIFASCWTHFAIPSAATRSHTEREG